MFALNKKDYNPQDLPSALIDQTLPQFSLPTVASDQLLSTRDITGDVFLLNVWATWCITCRAEHPHLNQLAEKGVKIVGVDYKDERQKAKDWLSKLGNPYAVNLFDIDGRLGLDLGVSGAPETYLIDQKGIIRYKHVGIVDLNVWNEKIKPLYDELIAQ